MDVNPRSVFAGIQNHIAHMDGMTIGIDRRSCFPHASVLVAGGRSDELATLDETIDVVGAGDPRIPKRGRRILSTTTAFQSFGRG